jgi:hypothetical protein
VAYFERQIMPSRKYPVQAMDARRTVWKLIAADEALFPAESPCHDRACKI